MAQTVVGIFERESFARQAVEHLKERGYTESDIDVHVRNPEDDKDDPTDTDSGSGGILGFFKSLFKNNDNDDDARSYMDLAGRNEAVVTVWVQSGSDAERAADILDEYGAVNIDEPPTDRDMAGTSRDVDVENIGTGVRSGTDTGISATNTSTSGGAGMAAKAMSNRPPVTETAGTGNTGAGSTNDANDDVQIGGTGQSPTGNIGSGTVQTGMTGVAGTGGQTSGSSSRSRSDAGPGSTGTTGSMGSTGNIGTTAGTGTGLGTTGSSSSGASATGTGSSMDEGTTGAMDSSGTGATGATGNAATIAENAARKRRSRIFEDVPDDLRRR